MSVRALHSNSTDISPVYVTLLYNTHDTTENVKNNLASEVARSSKNEKGLLVSILNRFSSLLIFRYF